MAKDDFVRTKIHGIELMRVANRKIKEAKDILAPPGSTHIGSVCLHFYSGIDLGTGNGRVEIVTQPVEVNINPKVVSMLISEIRDRVLEALGGTQIKLAPKTVQQAKDEGDHSAN